MNSPLTDTIADVARLEDLLSAPTPAAVDTLKHIAGDLLLLGAGGKMGPTLARMARRASDEAGHSRTVYAVSRFSDTQAARALQEQRIEVLRGDLLDPAFVRSLPDAPNVIHMTGMKFGAGSNAPLTWAMNTFVPAPWPSDLTRVDWWRSRPATCTGSSPPPREGPGRPTPRPRSGSTP